MHWRQIITLTVHSRGRSSTGKHIFYLYAVPVQELVIGKVHPAVVGTEMNLITIDIPHCDRYLHLEGPLRRVPEHSGLQILSSFILIIIFPVILSSCHQGDSF